MRGADEMNIKKLASLLFQRSVIVALLIFLQAAMLLLYMLWFSSDFIYVYWGVWCSPFWRC